MAGIKLQVAVIGAGTSGLMAIKAVKEEGFEPFCFEKSSYMGGLWKYHEEDTAGVPSVMWSTSLNNCKEAGAISDFPPKPEYPNYMRHPDVLGMFTEYAKKFDLFRHISYNKEVIAVARTADYDKNGRWQVVVKDTKTDEVTEHIFDAVMVCVGHLSLPDVPNFPGMKEYRGEVIHTHSVKKFHDFDGKKVCVVGTGSSALDAATETSHVANQVYLSVRTPAWISTRHGPYGYPIDWFLFTWDHNVLYHLFPSTWSDKFIQEVFINPRFSHDLFNIHPKKGISCRDPTISDSISSRLMNGSVILKKDIKRFTENGVIFEEEDTETEVDTVVLGTGYLWDFPFLDPSNLVIDGNKVYLYKCVYPPQLKFPTLGIIGFLVPLGPGFPCVEMQCRWFVRTLSGRCNLPKRAKMMSHIDKQYKSNVERFGNCSRVSVHVDFMDYLEDLASEIGACPSMLNLFFSDFQLFMACATGPYVPYRFRLIGPHKWNGARKAILEAGQRMRVPLQGKRALMEKSNPSKKSSWFSMKSLIASVLLILLYLKRNNLIFINHENLITLQRVYDLAKSLAITFIKSASYSFPSIQ